MMHIFFTYTIQCISDKAPILDQPFLATFKDIKNSILDSALSFILRSTNLFIIIRLHMLGDQKKRGDILTQWELFNIRSKITNKTLECSYLLHDAYI